MIRGPDSLGRANAALFQAWFEHGIQTFFQSRSDLWHSFGCNRDCSTSLSGHRYWPALYFLFWKPQVVGKLLNTLQHADGHSSLGGVWGSELGGLVLLHPSGWIMSPPGTNSPGEVTGLDLWSAYSTWEPEVVMGAHMRVPLVLLIMQYPGQLLRELVQAQKSLLTLALCCLKQSKMLQD